VFTLQNDQSIPRSSMVTLFGNPNDYVWRLANLSEYSNNSPIHVRYRFDDDFHAVAVDTQRRRVYYGNNALGRVHYLLIHNSDTKKHYYLAPPITKRVNFTVVSPIRYLTSCSLTTSIDCKILGIGSHALAPTHEVKYT